jgi:IMP and pyridine-specific 5'-nucleotidase
MWEETNPLFDILFTVCFYRQYAQAKPLTNSALEWIKGLLAVPFVLYSQPTGVYETNGFSVTQMSEEAHRRYAEIMRDVEFMIDDHSAHSTPHTP